MMKNPLVLFTGLVLASLVALVLVITQRSEKVVAPEEAPPAKVVTSEPPSGAQKPPEKPVGKFGKPLFQALSYHDTPEKPLPEMRFLDRTARAGEKHAYRIIAVNSAGLKSEPSQPVPIP